MPETWLAHGNPWEFERRERLFHRLRRRGDGQRAGPDPLELAEAVEAVAYDTPVVGWRGKRVNTLRLWSARAFDPIKLDKFNAGDHVGALASQTRAETLVRVLYPADLNASGRSCGCGRKFPAARRSRTSCAATSSISATSAPGRDPAQRYRPRGVGGGADAAVDGPSRPRFRQGVAGHYPRDLRLHQSHAAARGAGKLAAAAVRAAAAAAHAIGLCDQRPAAARGAQGAGINNDAISAISLIDKGGERRVRMANLAFAGAHSINGVAARSTPT
ncbi:glycogen/starch/alpha-glucan phosphorylase [Sphingomonas sp. MMS24-JH45]